MTYDTTSISLLGSCRESRKGIDLETFFEHCPQFGARRNPSKKICCFGLISTGYSATNLKPKIHFMALESFLKSTFSASLTFSDLNLNLSYCSSLFSGLNFRSTALSFAKNYIGRYLVRSGFFKSKVQFSFEFTKLNSEVEQQRLFL